jgi:hypothetical protein
MRWCCATGRIDQFSTIMASYRGFGSLEPKPFGLAQQLGTALVFSGILVNLSFKQRSKMRELLSPLWSLWRPWPLSAATVSKHNRSKKVHAD